MFTLADNPGGIYAEADMGVASMFYAQQGVNGGNLGYNPEPGMLLTGKIPDCTGQGGSVWLGGDRIRCGRTFKYSYLRQSFLDIPARPLQNFLHVYIHPQVGFAAKSCVQITIFTFS